MSWRDSAYKVMADVRSKGLLSGKTPTEIAKDIDAAYPFGERAMWPYKAWLAARKDFFAKHGLPRPRAPKPGLDLLSNLGD